LKEIVILSGKGGTGKTSLSAALCDLAQDNGTGSGRLVIVDADVDASNLQLLLKPEILEEGNFTGSDVAWIDPAICSLCGICQEVCRFEAVNLQEGQYVIDRFACEGCAACFYQCPEGAIKMQNRTAGEWYQSSSRFGMMFHAHLYAGQENSGKLVAFIKEKAKSYAGEIKPELVLVDGPPGVGCPVISAISGADFALMAAEPSLAGIHDLERVLDTANQFQVPAGVVINKFDMNDSGTVEIHKLCQERNIEIFGEIPFDLNVTRAMVSGNPVTSVFPESPASQVLRDIWYRLLEESSLEP
jgi:MinD superfamily P-loop ATPase